MIPGDEGFNNILTKSLLLHTLFSNPASYDINNEECIVQIIPYWKMERLLKDRHSSVGTVVEIHRW